MLFSLLPLGCGTMCKWKGNPKGSSPFETPAEGLLHPSKGGHICKQRFSSCRCMPQVRVELMRPFSPQIKPLKTWGQGTDPGGQQPWGHLLDVHEADHLLLQCFMAQLIVLQRQHLFPAQELLAFAISVTHHSTMSGHFSSKVRLGSISMG